MEANWSSSRLAVKLRDRKLNCSLWGSSDGDARTWLSNANSVRNLGSPRRRSGVPSCLANLVPPSRRRQRRSRRAEALVQLKSPVTFARAEPLEGARLLQAREPTPMWCCPLSWALPLAQRCRVSACHRELITALDILSPWEVLIRPLITLEPLEIRKGRRNEEETRQWPERSEERSCELLRRRRIRQTEAVRRRIGWRACLHAACAQTLLVGQVACWLRAMLSGCRVQHQFRQHIQLHLRALLSNNMTKCR